MNVSASALRPYAPLVVLLVTIAAGWMVFIRPLSAEQRRASGQLATLRQREIALRRELGGSAPRGLDIDPVTRFERRLASGNAAPELLEQLARIASASRAQNLLIETVEAGAVTPSSQAGLAAAFAPGASAPRQAGHDEAIQRDPRFSLFDVPVSHLPIRVAFDTGYAGLGRFLWAFRSLPTTIEIRELSVGLPHIDGDQAAGARADMLRVSLTLHAYARSAPAVMQASNTVNIAGVTR
jgi:hypothetical protein